MIERRQALAALVGAALAMPKAARAQTYPTRPVTIVVPYAAGGASDVIARLIAQSLSSLGQQFIVDNRPGAATLIGAQGVARAQPDGYTLLLATSTTLGINASLYPKLPYDPVRDFTPISLIAEVPFVLIVASSVKATTLEELVALSRQPGQAFTYGSAGSGSPHHLFMELLKSRTGLAAAHAAYKGTAPALNDIVGGQIQLMFADLAAAQSQIEAGTVKAVAVSTSARLPGLPRVPTVAEAGVAGYEATAWQGLVAPKGLSPDLVAALDAELRRAIATPTLDAKLRAVGLVPAYRAPPAFASLIASEIIKWATVVEISGAKVE